MRMIFSLQTCLLLFLTTQIPYVTIIWETNKIMKRLNLLPVASQFMNGDEKNRIFTPYLNTLRDLKPIIGDGFVETLPTVYFLCSGGVERLILDMHIQEDSDQDKPLYLIAHPRNNSLPAALEIMAWVRQQGKKGRIFFFQSPDDREPSKQLDETLKMFDVQRRMQNIRLGLLGKPSDWLVASSQSPSVMKKHWGPETILIDLDELKDLLSNQLPVQKPFDALLDKVAEPDDTEIEDAVRVYNCLKTIIETYDLHAITLRCFDLVTELQTTGCYALARLNDEGIVAGCEGDLPAVLTMLTVRELLDKPSWMANPAQINPNTNAILLAHCTAPCTMIDDISIRSHFESGLGVAIQGHLRRSPVTLLRIGGGKLDKLWVAEGNIDRTTTDGNLCRTQAWVHLNDTVGVSSLLDHPLGNHLVLVYGHHKETILRYFASSNLPGVY